MRVISKKVFLVALSSVVMGLSATPSWAEAQPAVDTALVAAQPEPAAGETEKAEETATATVPATDAYRDILSQPPWRWDTLIERRRDELAKRRRVRSEDWSRARRYWTHPWSEQRREAIDARREALRAQTGDRADYRQEWTDARRRFRTPWTQTRRDWLEQRQNLYRLQNLRLQEQMRTPYAYGTEGYSPYGTGPWGGGPWGVGGYGYPW